jgi:2-amino-4-hydroxy-6-hydroxymethyldihydropteridine diphosphokinase
VTRAFLALGSNLGDRAERLQRAVDGLAQAPGVSVTRVSRVYETAPVGGPPQDPFLNAVVEVDTTVRPSELLGVAQRLEREARRVRTERWGPRTLDVDLLLIDDLRVDEPELTVPHPRMWERGFVLAPLRDVAPALVPASASWEGVRVTAVRLIVRPGDHGPADQDGAPGEAGPGGGDGLA